MAWKSPHVEAAGRDAVEKSCGSFKSFIDLCGVMCDVAARVSSAVLIVKQPTPDLGMGSICINL